MNIEIYAEGAHPLTNTSAPKMGPTSLAAKYSCQERAARRNPPLKAFVTEAECEVSMPLVEVGVSRLDEQSLNY
ncbi:hypothetical protein [Desulfosporosinus lacus]|uniref:hypothetical protein n=1 Tax=Desulfosporosinus lacus TaxID=329936 RepID=UPI001160FF60|nr:hypothetical protein [Desulfosporosinus lacus]